MRVPIGFKKDKNDMQSLYFFKPGRCRAGGNGLPRGCSNHRVARLARCNSWRRICTQKFEVQFSGLGGRLACAGEVQVGWGGRNGNIWPPRYFLEAAAIPFLYNFILSARCRGQAAVEPRLSGGT